jgi:hypothetical protein
MPSLVKRLMSTLAFQHRDVFQRRISVNTRVIIRDLPFLRDNQDSSTDRSDFHSSPLLPLLTRLLLRHPTANICVQFQLRHYRVAGI